MVPDSVDLDYLRGKAAEYRRHARAAPGQHQATWLIELASRYEARVSELESQHRPKKTLRSRHGRS
jgi:hypothetical protein